MTSAFARLGVPARLAAVLAARGIDTPTPIQAATLPDAFAGRDVLGRGRTGSGKTYAFALPVVARLAAERDRSAPGRPRALILAPTRELAAQIAEAVRPLADIARLTTLTLFGGVNQNPQVRGLKAGVDVLVATPGRLLDLREQGHLSLADVRVTVIDEADHMSDMGFLPVNHPFGAVDHFDKSGFDEIQSREPGTSFAVEFPERLVRLGRAEKVVYIEPRQRADKIADLLRCPEANRFHVGSGHHMLDEMVSIIRR